MSNNETLKVKMEKIEETQKEIKEDIKELPTRDEMKLANKELLEDILNKADKRYASKLTEKIVYGLISLVVLFGLAVLVATAMGIPFSISL